MAATLTPKQEKFCLAFIESANGSQAYRKAYNAARMKDKQVHEEASKLLATPKIAQRVNELRALVAEKTAVKEARVLEECARLGLYDPRKLFRADGSPKDITELDDATAAAITGLEVMEVWQGTGKDRVFVGYLKKYKLADKNPALEKLMKHLGMFEKDNKQKAGMFDNVPREVLELIEEKLRELDRFGMAGSTDARSPSRFTH